jgi:hypothetical protein
VPDGDGEVLHNFYVPAGGDIPDPALNPKFAHKLKFVDEATAWFAGRRAKENRFILLGDLNIAPLETDVWSHKQLLKVVSHTPVEVELMARWYASHDWVDAVRRFVPPEQKLYSWWSYRAPDWAAADKGRRLDHIWVTPKLEDQLGGIEVFREARGWPEPSDHVPVRRCSATMPASSQRRPACSTISSISRRTARPRRSPGTASMPPCRRLRSTGARAAARTAVARRAGTTDRRAGPATMPG